MAKDQNPDEWTRRIQPLIERVDHECRRRMFTPYKTIAFIIIVAFYLFAFIGLIIQLFAVLNAIGSYAKILPTQEEQLKFLIDQLSSYSSLSVSIIAVELTIVPVLLAFPRTKSEELARWYYSGDLFHDGLSKNTAEKDRPLLKALINMKCKEFDLVLSHIHHDNPNWFEEETLLKNLYS